MEHIETIPISIKLFLKDYKKIKKESYPIYAQIILNRMKVTISLKMSTTEEDWDFENELYLSDNKFNKVRNNKISEMKEKLVDIYRDLKKSNQPVSAKGLKRSYMGETSVSTKMKFLEFYKIHVEEIKLRTHEYGAGVIEHYNKTLTHLTRFLDKKGWSEIALDSLSKNFIERFENYLLSTPNAQSGQPMNRNTATTYLKKLKATVNAAIKQDLLKVNPFTDYKIKSYRSVNLTFLTQEEIDAMKTHNLGGNLSLQRIRDIFLFSCYTGLRYSDASRLKDAMVRRDEKGLLWIVLKQQKTSENVEIPMMEYAVEIYDKYEIHRKRTGFVLPILTNQKINTGLKTIADLVGITKQLTHHCARHTFGTSLLEQGIDIKSVSNIMGHSSIKSTEIYAKLTRKRKADVIEILNKKKVEKEKVR